MKNKITTRNSNFELLRIVCMLMIITWHVILHGNVVEHTYGIASYFFQFILVILSVNVNCFILISGYYQYDKPFSKKKFLSILCMGWFYKVLLTLIFTMTGLYELDTFELIRVILPLEFNDYWFLTAYLALYALSPFLNILIKNMNQQTHRKCILVLFLLFCVISTITHHNTFTNGGCSYENLIILYIIGAYLRKYPLKENIHFKNYSIKKTRIILITLFLISNMFLFLTTIFSEQLLTINSSFLNKVSEYIDFSILRFSNPVIMFQSVIFFLFFETLDIKSNFINKISKYMFGIYLAHENRFVIKYFYEYIFKCLEPNYVGFKTMLLKVILSVIFIFICGLIIESIRILIVNIIKKIRTSKGMTT